MGKNLIGLAGVGVLLGLMGHAEAALVGMIQKYPDVTLGNTYLIYDHDALQTFKNGVCNSNSANNACIGQLTLVSFSATLYSGPMPAPSATQVYSGGADSTPDKTMTIAIKSSGPSAAVGSWTSSTNASANRITITPGTTPTDVGTFSWLGNVNNFGWLADNTSTSNYYELGTQFDGLWKMTSDAYSNLPAGMSQFVNGALTSAMATFNGGYKISNSAGFTQDGNPLNTVSSNRVTLADALKRDWVFGTNANTSAVQALLAPYLGGLSATNCGSNTSINCVKYLASDVLVDVFVPIPPALWLWAGALTALVPSVRRIKNHRHSLSGE